MDFCERENVQPIINAASFGKLIRQQFSSLTTRRLGTRGKSKYHYYGLGIKPTSLYYNEEYCKKQKEGVARKEPESKKVHPIYPKENPSTILPPFPDVNQLKFLQDVSKGKVRYDDVSLGTQAFPEYMCTYVHNSNCAGADF